MSMYRGVVEDNNDPDKISRVKVRIHGIHSEDKELVKTADLPWTEVAGSTAFGLVSGVGVSSVLRNGTWVWLMLEQGDINKAIVIGTINGVNSEAPDTSKGFNDPDGEYPLESRVNFMEEGAEEVPRNNRSDLHPEMDAEYPNTQVIETPNGHVIILSPDDIKLVHNTGTRITIDVDGNMDIKTVKNISHNIDANSEDNVAGTITLTPEGNMKIDSDLEITGDVVIKKKLSVTSDITSSGEVFDSKGTLDVVRVHSDTHIHTGNLGSPTTPCMVAGVHVPPSPVEVTLTPVED